jgi:hypothetical protein
MSNNTAATAFSCHQTGNLLHVELGRGSGVEADVSDRGSRKFWGCGRG